LLGALNTPTGTGNNTAMQNILGGVTTGLSGIGSYLKDLLKPQPGLGEMVDASGNIVKDPTYAVYENMSPEDIMKRWEDVNPYENII